MFKRILKTTLVIGLWAGPLFGAAMYAQLDGGSPAKRMAASLIATILFGTILGSFVGMFVELIRRLHKSDGTFEDEHVLFEDLASHYGTTFRKYSGWMLLTSSKLIFYRAARKNEGRIDLPLSSIEKIETGGHPLLNLFRLGLTDTLIFQGPEGQETQFRVSASKAWLQAIEKAAGRKLASERRR